jgi:hypothetical protein
MYNFKINIKFGKISKLDNYNFGNILMVFKINITIRIFLFCFLIKKSKIEYNIIIVKTNILSKKN